MSRLAKLVTILCSLLGFQTLGYLMYTWRSGASILRISGVDVRSDVAWPVAVLLIVPLFIALLRSALFTPAPKYTSATLLRRWIQLQMNGEISDDFVAARRLQGR